MASLLNNSCVGNIKISTTGGSNGVQMGTGIAAPTGNGNTVMGACALMCNNGGNNVAIGYKAVRTGTGCCNIGIGAYALSCITSGNQNVAIGAKAGCSITTSSDNTSVGYFAANGLSTGVSNTAVGAGTFFLNGGGYSNSTIVGSKSISCRAGTVVVGCDSSSSAIAPYAVVVGNDSIGNGTCAIIIGHNITLGCRCIRWGNSSNNACNCAWNTWTSISDCRDKADITPLSDNLGLNFIRQLRPTSFKSDPRDTYVRECGFEYGVKDGTLKKEEHDYGFIAQEVKNVAESLNTSFDAVLYNSEEDQYKLTYEELIAPIVKAIQAIDVRVQTLKSKVII